MRTVGEIRLQNLELLIQEAGGAEGLAARVDSSPVYISQVRNRAMDHKTKKPRELGTQMARRLEVAFARPRGWMDVSHGQELSAAPAAQLFVVGEAPHPPYGMLARQSQSQGQTSSVEDVNELSQDTTKGDALASSKSIAGVTKSITEVPILAWANLNQMLNAENADLKQTAPHLETFATCSARAKFIAMPDDAMAPDIQPGDHLLIDPTESPRAGDIVLVRLPSGENFIRSFKLRTALVFDAIPFNSNYQALSSRDDLIEVVGVMIEHRRYRRKT